VKRRKKNDDDDDDEEPSDDDGEVSSNADPPAPTSDEEMSDGEGRGTDSDAGSEKLGRGARGRAKVSSPPYIEISHLIQSLRQRLGKRLNIQRSKMFELFRASLECYLMMSCLYFLLLAITSLESSHVYPH
jgi:hypothetical protein